MEKSKEAAERDLRVETAIQLNEPDRVPFVPKVAEYPMRAYGIDIYEGMMDSRNMIPGYLEYAQRIEPDAIFIDGFQSIPTLKALWPNNLRWPGADHGLPLNASWQQLDGMFLEDDEFAEYIEDPTHTSLTKIFPRKYANLKGLAKVNLRESFDMFFCNDLVAFADPEVQSALAALVKAGEAQAAHLSGVQALVGSIVEAGFSPFNHGVAFAPFDTFADGTRGIVQAIIDIIEYPDEMKHIIDFVYDSSTSPMIKNCKAMGGKRVFIPLHCGVDEFMSPDTYAEFYWPCVKRTIMEIVDEGMTPVVFCEGNYNTRLDVISDVPKGKVVYMFEKVDLQKAKDTVGKVACICGTVPLATLAFGSKQQIIDETRRQINILAPGGGFIMDASITISNVSHENMAIWKEATLEYGSY